MALSFTDGPVPFRETGAPAVAQIKRLNPRVFCAFVRNKNGNVVVLEGVVNRGRLQGVTSFWLDLESNYKAAARKRGRAHDRDELGMLDHRAYGYTVKPVNDTTLMVTFNQVPRLSMTVTLEKDGAVRARGVLNGKHLTVNYIYVHATTTALLFPRVEYIEVVGTTPQGALVRDRI